jgi:hypothetical protein
MGPDPDRFLLRQADKPGDSRTPMQAVRFGFRFYAGSGSLILQSKTVNRI